ncbi:hypothetical protein CC2G_014214 [Coprinopsis cinerea AmutBmut pab1-1]|nr:hypothetical protein CC2G_014214 [Coprinopsis cinerea AmutBmut pab1-1]
MESLVNLNRVSLSCLTLLVYDYLCTFSQEVEYVWTNSLSVGVVLFYLNRYLVFFDQSLLFFFNTVTFVNASTCERLFRSGVWLKAIGSNVASYMRAVGEPESGRDPFISTSSRAHSLDICSDPPTMG